MQVSIPKGGAGSTDRGVAQGASPAACRPALRVLGLLYLVFVCAGSLVPYAFTPLPWDLAWARYLAVMGAPPAQLSRVDVGVNVLLFIPLAWLWCGALFAGRRFAWLGVLLLLPVWPSLAGVIEFAQLAFPPRVTSPSDLLAESVGGLLGSLLWLASGRAVCAAILGWAQARSVAGRWPLLLGAYLVGLLGYSLLPLDLSLSPADLYDKWRSGHVVLLPFGFAYKSAAEAWLDRALEVAIWVPVGLLATLATRASSRRVLLLAAALALLLQVVKLPVLSRVSDLTDVLLALAGAGLGIALARLGGHGGAGVAASRPAGAASLMTKHLGLRSAAVLVYALLLPAMFWFPYEFRADPGFVRERIAAWSALPFAALFGTEELHAATTIVRRVLAFAPLGALLVLVVEGLPVAWRRWASVGAALFALGVVVLVQAGQLLVPERHPDATSAALMLLGAALGALAVAGWPRGRAPAVVQTSTTSLASPWWRPWLIAWVLLALGLWLITQAPGVPYNLPGVLSPRAPWASAALIAAAMLAWAAWPLVARRVAHIQAPAALLWRWPLAWACLMGVASLALYSGAEWARVVKLVGTMRLPWPEHLEAWARLTVLLGAPAWLLLGGSLLAWARTPRIPARCALLAVWLALSCVLLPFAYWVIVVEAATDNLVELLADDASPMAAAGVAAWWWLSGAGAMGVARAAEARAWVRALLVLALTALLGWAVLAVSLESALFKYGASFSALQFLLSPDRQHYLGVAPLVLRYALVHGALLVLLAWAWRPLARARAQTQASPVMRPSARSIAKA